MLNSVYIALILCLVASNFNRILWICRWLYRYLDSSQNDGLVPYFNQDGILIGMVRTRPDIDRPRAPSSSDDSEFEQELPVGHVTKAHSSGVRPSAPIAPPLVWDFWPNGNFQRLFSVQELADNNDLAANWVLETIRTSGSLHALTWQKGKQVLRRCVGVIQCRKTDESLAEAAFLLRRIGPARDGYTRSPALLHQIMYL
ncbi:hypothetical protein C8R46DRAFT_1125485 [Mycena filopes]|nr:hypothetical protein C8R46DRAFT_1125485 [Mycena filopes]